MNSSSLLGSFTTFVNVPTAIASLMADPPIADFQNITNVIKNITTSVFDVATALVALMVIIAGIYMMFNRDSSVNARLERLSFLKTVLTGYAIIFAGNFLVQLITTSLQSGGINHTP